MISYLYNESMDSPLTEWIAGKICELIHKQELSVKEKIPNEFVLAELFHVGRGTVREAIKLLISRNILEIHRGRGTFVCEKPGVIDDPFGFNYVGDKIQLTADLVAVRYILEPEIAAFAARYASDSAITKMKELADTILDLAKDDQDFYEADTALHTAIAESSRNMVMPNLIPIICYGIDIYNHELVKYKRLEAVTLHFDIIGAIEKHDPAAAKQAMQAHLQYNQENILRCSGDPV
jgi:DNA-binding FadR family transcriptional regulator